MFPGGRIMSTVPILEVSGLTKTFHVGSRFSAGGRQNVQALAGVSFEVFAGETLGLVGESAALRDRCRAGDFQRA